MKHSVDEAFWKDCRKERVKVCGECYKQNPDFPTEVDCMDYAANSSDYRVGRDRMKMKESTLTAVEMKAFRGLLQWFIRIAGCEVNLASKMSSPKVEGLAEASKLIRMVKSEHYRTKE